jgi:hypothetical protein
MAATRPYVLNAASLDSTKIVMHLARAPNQFIKNVANDSYPVDLF